MILSIVICTHNRSQLLKKCLDSLVQQLTDDVEVLIVDNNSPDNTFTVVKAFSEYNPNIRYVFESKTGLSNARNTGWSQATSDWILYLDDDAIAFPDMVSRAKFLIEKDDFDCIGGMYFGYFEDSKPKWIPDGFGDKEAFTDSLTSCSYRVPNGGIILYKKVLLKKVGGFDPNFGMIGNKKKFGEEIELNYRAEEMGFRIGFDPELKIWHFVKEEYLTIWWMLKRKFLVGQAMQRIDDESYSIRIYWLIRSIIDAVIIRLPKKSVKLFKQKQYYYQNWIIDVWCTVFLRLGKLLSDI